MTHDLLATKTQIPPQPQRLMPRARLRDTLEHGVIRYRLTVVTAPAGYGKTTFLVNWARTSQFPIVWFSIGEEDNDLFRFLRYLIVGWDRVQPGMKESPLGLLLGSEEPDQEAVLSTFINVANELPGPIIFLLDDYHLIDDPFIHEALTFLLDRLPSTVHFVLASRTEPPLPLARYRARHQLLEFTAEELQFSPEETAAFLTQLMNLDLTPDEIAGLQGRLEGWITGLQLVALTLQRRRQPIHELNITGRQRFIADYLAEDVLAQLPEAMCQFLLQTSIVDRLCGALCEAITQESGGQEMLELVERENLFLVPLDDNRHWFRYHRLFADFLQAELQRRHPDIIVHLHRRAAQWYLAHEYPEPAFQHAVAAGDIEQAVRVVDRYVAVQMLRGEYKIAQYWLNSFSHEQFAQYPVLFLYRAIFFALTGQFDGCFQCVDEVEQRLQTAESGEEKQQKARLLAVRTLAACIQADLARAEGFATQAFTSLSEDDLLFQCMINIALGDTYRRLGHWQDAEKHYIAFLNLARKTVYRFGAVHALGALADLHMQRGQIRRAAEYWQEAIAAMGEADTWGALPLPLMGWSYIRLAEILYEWNKLSDAREHVDKGLGLAELGGDVRALIAGYLTMGRISLAEGDIEAARAFLEKVRPLVENVQFREWRARFERFQLELWLAEDSLREAISWRAEASSDHGDGDEPESDVSLLSLARTLIVEGDPIGLRQALRRLQNLTETAGEEEHTVIYVEALALQALVHWASGERPEAMLVLERTLRLAEREGYVRLFIDLGLPMMRMLQDARARDVVPGYVGTLLAAFAANPSLPAIEGEVLPEPLTPREQEVLELLAAGLTYREAAEKLIISPETVKKHVGSIYGKLAVGNRTEAIIRARELNLLA